MSDTEKETTDVQEEGQEESKKCDEAMDEDPENGSDTEFQDEEYYDSDEDSEDEELELIPAFSDDDIEMFRSAFSLFDLDGNGVICAKELGTLLRALGQNPTDDELDELMIALDRNENGVVEFEEFIKLMEERIDTSNYSGELDESRTMGEEQKDVFREAFKVFDKDGNGKISADELRSVVTSYGKMKLTSEEADEMIKSADVDGDGQINYEEFVSLFTGVHIIRAAAELESASNK